MGVFKTDVLRGCALALFSNTVLYTTGNIKNQSNFCDIENITQFSSMNKF